MASFEESESEFLVRCTVPEGLTISQTKYGWGLFSTAHFPKGQILYTGKNLLQLLENNAVLQNDYYLDALGYHILLPDKEKNVRLVTNIGEFAMTMTTHSVAVGVGSSRRRELFSFDGFMNHRQTVVVI